jgi:hypothetical protein
MAAFKIIKRGDPPPIWVKAKPDYLKQFLAIQKEFNAKFIAIQKSFAQKVTAIRK